jgi:hypothetical protein
MTVAAPESVLRASLSRRRAPIALVAGAATIAYFSRYRRGMRNLKGVPMKNTAMSALMVGALGLASVATTSPAEAHWRGGWGGWGPGIAGGLVAGAVIGGIASSAYGSGPNYGYYGGPGYDGAGYYGGPYTYDYGYDEPYRWGGGYTTTYYTAPVSYGYRYRRVVRPAYAYYRGSYPVIRHRWHRHHHW